MYHAHIAREISVQIYIHWLDLMVFHSLPNPTMWLREILSFMVCVSGHLPDRAGLLSLTYL